MDWNPGFTRNKPMGFTLIEVTAALFILAVLILALTACFSTTGIWFSQARDKDRASVYAASIVNVLRTYSIEMKNELEREGVLRITDPDSSDDRMEFILDGTAIQIDSPEEYCAEIEAAYFDDRSYYQWDVASGLQSIGEGDNAAPVFFKDNLMEVDIKIKWGGGDYRLSTIMGAR